MKTIHLAAAAAAGALAMLAAMPASATVYNLDDYSAAFTPPLGTVSVTGQGTNVLAFDVNLANNVFFQLTGNGSLHDAFWFDLTGLVGGTSVTYNITSPGGGDFPTGGLFTGGNFNNNHYGQGFLSGSDYAVQVQDTSAGANLNYYTGHLTFTVTGGAGSTLDLGARNINGTNVFAGADLRECSTVACTTILATGPVGATLGGIIPQGGVPEPATWAMMIIGFGGVGAILRRRRGQMAATFA